MNYNWIFTEFSLVLNWRLNSISNGFILVFHWNFNWIFNNFYWHVFLISIGILSTGLTIDSTRYPLELLLNSKWISNRFSSVFHGNQMDIPRICIGISLKFQVVFHWYFNWISNGLPLVFLWSLNFYLIKMDFNKYFFDISI